MVHSSEWLRDISCTTSRPARARYAAAICTDANYLPYALFVAKGLHDMHDLAALDIVLCVTDDCKIPEGLAYLDLRVCRIDTGTTFSDLYLDARRTEAVYHRLALPHLLGDDYDRILYLDCDTFIQGDAFARLFSVEMNGLAIAAVRDLPQWILPTKELRAFADKTVPANKYLNSGVMLFDTASFRSTRILERCVSRGKELAGQPYQHDQDLINEVLQGDWVELSPVWNWQRPVSIPYNGTMLPINIVHFIGWRKPWKDTDHRISPRFKQALNAFLQRQFPEHRLAPIRYAPTVVQIGVLTQTSRVARFSRAMKRYLARFPDDMVAQD